MPTVKPVYGKVEVETVRLCSAGEIVKEVWQAIKRRLNARSADRVAVTSWLMTGRRVEVLIKIIGSTEEAAGMCLDWLKDSDINRKIPLQGPVKTQLQQPHLLPWRWHPDSLLLILSSGWPPAAWARLSMWVWERGSWSAGSGDKALVCEDVKNLVLQLTGWKTFFISENS